MSLEKLKEVSKGIIFYVIAIIMIFISLRLFIFYSPFLIGFIIAEILEPIIKFVKNKTNLTRKTSSIIVLIFFFIILVSIISFGVIYLISEVSNVLLEFNIYLERIMDKVQEIENMIDLKVNNEIKAIIENTLSNYISDVGILVKNYLTNFIKTLGKLPYALVYLIITILSTYFISSDKFYILDMMEYHFPKKWIGNIRDKVGKIKNSLGSYLKAEIIMIIVSFFIVLVGLYIFNLIGLSVEYPLLFAILIGFVDALPILGSGTVLVPWSIISFINNDIHLGSALLGLYIFVIVAKQIIEPKIVSNKIGIHPIFTLIAMYTGFKMLGLIGLLVGPIMLIIFKNIFSNTIDKGFVNSILEKF